MYGQDFNLICNNINSGILILDKNLVVKYWNKWLEIQTKIKSEDILEKSILDFYDNINPKVLLRKVKTTLRLNSPTFYNTEQTKYLFDIKLNKIADSIFLNMQQSVTISPFNLEKELVIVYIYDNTLQSETNFKLQKSKEELEKRNIQLEEKNNEFERMINALTEGLIISSENGYCENINNLGLKLLGLKDKEEIVNKHLLDFVANESKDLVKINLQSEQLRTYEVELIRKDNKQFSAFVSGQVIQLDNKKKRISTMIDISHIKQKDNLISRQAKLADMGQMIGNIAHQWRQPLSLISSSASGLKLYRDMDKLNDEIFNETVEQIVKTTTHLSQTIDDFRNFIKDDKEKTVFCLNDIIRKDLSLLDGVIKTSHITIDIKKQEEDIILKGYPNELIQAIMNILTNSKDALESSSVEDKLILIEVSKADHFAYLKIYDNANGIDETIKDKIFQPYFTTKHKSQGTGLGLFMTHRIINDSMDGTIKVENIYFNVKNKEYKGACFTVELPLYKD
ncbi:MAG: ATP-binding protein [Campylobacterota bacterium]